MRLTVPTSRRLFHSFQHTRLSQVSTRIWDQVRLEGWEEGKSVESKRPDRTCRKNFLDQRKALEVELSCAQRPTSPQVQTNRVKISG